MKKVILKPLMLAVLLMSTLFTACEGDLDINDNPLQATSIPPELLYPQIFLQSASNRSIELNSVNIQAQHWTSGGSAGVFRNPEQYIISPFTAGNFFTSLFTGQLRNLQLARELLEEARPSELNSIGQLEVFRSFIFLNATQMFEDVPFTQATQVAEFPEPAFDSQETILRGVAANLESTINTYLASDTAIVTDQDLIFGGDRLSWVRFANSLRLKALMLIANVDPGSVSAEIQAYVSDPSMLITNNSQNAQVPFSGAPQEANPLFQTLLNFGGGANPFWYGGSTLVDLMNTNNDPRRNTFFDQEAGGVFVGQDQGVFSPTGISNVSLNILRADLEERMATAAETNFFLAEAILKGFATGDAQAFYAAGLQASLDSYDGQPGEIPQADKDAYIAARGTLSGNTTADIRLVNEEQYVSLFTRGIEAFTHWRRTGVPDFQQPVGAALPDIIRRYPYPAEELGSNSNSPAGNPPLETPMWFEN